ncbi:MAG TPA: pyridoxamine 5'-phosphate oxidase [Alphaproteobacteria bacterium]|nr:pyridoxamine 5'-phosphate oxidase [Alphaproteobacteria bacterium]
MIENIDFTPPADPWTLFRDWYALAETNEPNDANAMALATVGEGGMPSVRVVLMKSVDENGLVFFTNRESHKGNQLAQHAKAATVLHWKSLKRQIRAEGIITQVTDAESDAYHATRPRGSQIGAWVSQQSRPLNRGRAELEEQAKAVEKQYEGKPVPRPPYWGGYRLAPLMLEFWQERQYRLHDRIVYRRATVKDGWNIERLYP